MKYQCISHDLWYEIIKGLNMQDVVKLSFVNPFYYDLCNNNEIWKVFYNKLFDRRMLTENAKHIGPVSWFHCRCIAYPGWTNIHKEIDNSNFICKKLDHYENLDEKVLKKNFKDFKKQTKKRYIHLLRNDNLVTNNHVIVHEKRKTENEIKRLMKKLQNINEKNEECKTALAIIHS